MMEIAKSIKRTVIDKEMPSSTWRKPEETIESAPLREHNRGLPVRKKPLRTLMKKQVIVWTIGHSDRSVKAFIEMLKEHEIQVLADIRHFPTSKIEHFKREHMEKWLPENGIEYVWLGKELGGYRKGGYKKYMRTKLFRDGVKRLLEIASQKRTCMMCMEPNPRYCHRRFIAVHLEKKGVKVVHIIAKRQKALL